MAFQLGEEDTQGINEMNLIPLIDIMLVLMTIFLVTATVMNPSIPLALPKTSAKVNEQPPEVVHLSIDKTSTIFWNDMPVTLPQLQQKLSEAANSGKNPSLQLRADKEGKYDTVAQVLAAASQAGLNKIAFVSE